MTVEVSSASLAFVFRGEFLRRSFVPSFLPSFLHSFLCSLLRSSFVRSFLSSLLRSSFRHFLCRPLSWRSSFLPSFVRSFVCCALVRPSVRSSVCSEVTTSFPNHQSRNQPLNNRQPSSREIAADSALAGRVACWIDTFPRAYACTATVE